MSRESEERAADRGSWAGIGLVLAAALFSTGGAAIKGLSLDAWQTACLRSLVAAAALAIAVPAARRRWTHWTLLVGLAYAATMILFVAGNKLTTAMNTIFLQSTAPLWVLLLAPWLLAERVRRADVLCGILMALGLLFFLIGREEPSATAPDPVLGNLLAGVAGLTWAFTIMGIRRLARQAVPGANPAAAAILAGNLIAAAVCIGPALPLGEVDVADGLLIIWLGVFQIGLAYLLLTRSMRWVPSPEAALLLLVEPVLSPVWAWIFHGERPSLLALLGGAVILLGSGLRTGADRLARR
jgi:drug/metabolite transporter (DMT)-like permease